MDNEISKNQDIKKSLEPDEKLEDLLSPPPEYFNIKYPRRAYPRQVPFNSRPRYPSFYDNFSYPSYNPRYTTTSYNLSDNLTKSEHAPVRPKVYPLRLPFSEDEPEKNVKPNNDIFITKREMTNVIAVRPMETKSQAIESPVVLMVDSEKKQKEKSDDKKVTKRKNVIVIAPVICVCVCLVFVGVIVGVLYGVNQIIPVYQFESTTTSTSTSTTDKY